MVRSDVAGEKRLILPVDCQVAKGLTIQVLHTRTDRYTNINYIN